MANKSKIQFNINNYISSFKGSRELLSRYHSANDIEYYIIIKTDPENFLGRISERDVDELSGFFYSIPKMVNKGENVPILKYAYTLHYEVFLDFDRSIFNILDYIKLFGLYNFRKYLDSIDIPTDHSYECIVSRDLFNTDAKYKPKIIGNTLTPPINANERTQFEEILNERVLRILYEIGDARRGFFKKSRDELAEFFFCDEIELYNSERYLIDEKLIAIPWRITTKGKKIVMKSNKTPTKSITKSSFAFVAQSFSSEMIPYFDSLFSQPIKNCKFKPQLISNSEPEKGLDSAIFSSIENCAFMVADLTEERPSVYVEAGYALGIGKKVFFCAREDYNTDFPGWKAGKPKVHFDIRNYKVTWWNQENFEPAIIELTNRINTWLKGL